MADIAQTDSAPAEQPTGVRWLVFSLACGTSWFLYVHRYTWNLVRPALKEEYNFSNTELEALGSAFYASYTIFQVPSGIVTDLFGPRMFLGAIIILWALCLPLLGLTRSLSVLSGIRFMFGAAQAGGYPALGNVTRNWFRLAVRTRIQGWVASFFGRAGGGMSSIIMSTILMGWLGFGWRGALVVMSAAGVVFAILFVLLFRNTPADDPRVNEAEVKLIAEGEPPAVAKKGVLSFRAALKNRPLQVLIFQQFCNAGADVTYTNLTGSYFASKGIDFTSKASDVASKADAASNGISFMLLGFLVSLPLFGGAIGGVAGGYLNDWLIDRTGSRRWGRAIIGVMGKLIAAPLLFIAVTRSTPLEIGCWLFVVKFFSDWTQPTVWGTCTDLGGRHSATVFSINNTSGNLGAMVLPIILVGPLLDAYTTETMVNGEAVPVTDFTPVFVLMGILYVLSAVSWLAIDCTKRIEAEPNPA